MDNSLWRDKNVLVVDDSLTTRTLVREMLGHLPAQLEQAASAVQFQQRVRERVFDLVLLDLRLPDGNGIELLRGFRSLNSEATVVLITGEAEIATATEALSEGADGYLEKSHLKQGPLALRLTLEHAMLRRARVLAEREFQAVIVHELRGPAAAASVALRMYRESARSEVLDSAVRSLDRLFERLDRYLDYTRMEALAWKLNLRPYDLCELIEEALEPFPALALQKGQTLKWTPPGPAPARLDPNWMAQALENLLSNAVKYTVSGGTIQLRLLSEPDWWLLEIQDNGCGIPKNLQARVFQRYFRARSGEKGTGLGLLVAKNVAEAHGGRLTLDSSGVEGEGCLFRLILPR